MVHDTSHLIAIQERLSRESERLAEAKTEHERLFREVQVRAAKREIEWELKFLKERGVELYDNPNAPDDDDDDAILAELFE